MKYYKSNGFLKAICSTGFISVVACVLIAIGAIAWFALSRNVNTEQPLPDNEKSYIEPDSSYNTDNNSIQEPTPSATDVTESVDDVPYVEEKPILTESNATTETIKFIMPVEGNVFKEYSDTALQYSETFGDMRLHTGIDILCELGSEIKSAGSGTVKSITEDANYGKIIIIDHTAELSVKYCGFKEINVKEGDIINSGDIIGILGEIPCECADEPHLHIEALVKNVLSSPLEALNLK